MKLIYDKDADAVVVRFADSKIVESDKVSQGLIVDYDADGRIVSIEMLDAGRRLAPQALADIKAA